MWKALNDMHDCVTEQDEPVFDRCSVFKLNYSAYSNVELATWDRNEDIPNNTQTVKCNKWVYDQTQVISNAVTEVCKLT